ncbi:MAG: D-alanine--D-alanine ligase [Tannerella sp.]|jgi:D-alanine-D-alanine ligase|nr:D-alanine--D-alanine ligase [Tannerella sp.]
MMKNIAIVAGGYSSENEVSMKSAESVRSFIDKERYNLFIVVINRERWYALTTDGSEYEIDKNDFSFLLSGEKVKFDFVYNIIHGTPGEDGRLQGYLDMLGIPYSSSGTLAAALTFNKYFNNTYLKGTGIRVADSVRLTKNSRYDTEKIVEQLGLPLFVKPNDGGSSFGVSKVKEAAQLNNAIEKAFAEGCEVIIESYVKGTEVTCGCYKTKSKEVVFPVTEVVTENEFFDYDAKYNGQVQEITPARISHEMTELIQAQTSKIYDLTGSKGIIRIDYIIPEDNRPVLLEINTTPGMTATSFIPQQIKAEGLDIKEVLTEIIENEF